MTKFLSAICLALAVTFSGTLGAMAAEPVHAQPVRRFNVQDYGAKADGTADAGPAIRRAVQEAGKLGQPAVVFLPAGKYRLGQRTIAAKPGVSNPPHILIENARDLVVEGEKGTLLVSADLTRNFFTVSKCENVTLRNMELDSDPLPYTQGTVEAVDLAKHTVDLCVEKGYDDLDRADFQTFDELRIFDNPLYEGWKINLFPVITGRESLGPGKWRLTVAQPTGYQLKAEVVGKKWILWRNHYDSWAVTFISSSKCLAEGIRIYAGGNGGYDICGNPGDITVRKSYIGPGNTGRLFTASGGGMEFFNRGTVTFEDCDFSHIDDDGFNMGTHFMRILEQVDPYTCRTPAWPAVGTPLPGDSMVVWDWIKKEERGSAKVAEAHAEPGGTWLIRLDKPVEIQRTGPGDPKAEKKEAENDGIDRIINMTTAGRAVIRNNRISSLRARCILIKAPNSLIEGNTFHDTHMPGILAGPEFYWGEGPSLHNLVIRNNIFRRIDGSNIYLCTDHSDTGKGNRAVRIEGNTFEDCGHFPNDYLSTPHGLGIYIRNTEHVLIQNNIFCFSNTPQSTPQVQIEVSGKVRILKNQGLDPLRIKDEAGARISETR